MIINHLTPHYRSEGRRQESYGVFWGALSQYLRTLGVRISLNMFYKIDDWVEFFSREKIKFTYLSKKNQVTEMKNVLLWWAR